MCKQLVCLKPEIVPKIMAKFISPFAVQQILCKDQADFIQILQKKV